ncbi:MAG: exodeoxyribonuclease III [Cyclobacteriaceae bacterium]
MHIVSWNVNGIRAIMKKDFLKDVAEMNPDIICLQETKAQIEDAKKALEVLDGYHIYLNSSKARKGYSGTAIITKEEPIEVSYDMGIEEHDQEGRVITAEYGDFFLVTVYTPNSGEGMKRLDYRSGWDEAFKNHIAALNEQKPVIVCGDLNVAHEEIDIARPSANYNKSSGYTQTEIDGFDEILATGFTDTFRHFYPDLVKYSWWNYRFKARERNVGWRIDYFLTSDELLEKVEDSLIYNDRFGSDHCPIAIKINL